MSAAVDKIYTLLGVAGGLFGVRRLQEEGAWRSWPATVGQVLDPPLKGYRFWQNADLPEGSPLFVQIMMSLPLYTLYRYLVRDRPGVFLSVAYGFDTSGAARMQAAKLLGVAAEVPVNAASRAESFSGKTELRVTRDLWELPPEQARAAAKSDAVLQAAASLPPGQEVIIHFNPSMPKQNMMRPPAGFAPVTDGEKEGYLILGAASILLLVGRRRPIAKAFRRYGG